MKETFSSSKLACVFITGLHTAATYILGAYEPGYARAMGDNG